MKPGISRLAFPDATKLLADMQAGARRCVDVVREHIDRLEASQDRLNAAVQVFRNQALTEAMQPRPGPLSGLPMSVKETFGIQGETITAGSLRMPPIEIDEDAEVIKRVREAGAIIVARSNVPEFAMAAETENLRYGRTNNPLDPQRTCGGSSGGEGALVASGASAAGLGSDLLGSLRIPGAFCGVVGFKPASDAVDKWGTWPVIDGYMDSWLAVGPITRSVRDARLLYNVIADRKLPALGSVADARLVIPSPFSVSRELPCLNDAIARATDALESRGMRKEPRPFPEAEQYFLNLQPLLVHDIEDDLHRQLVTQEGDVLSLPKELARQLMGRPTIYGGLFQLLAASVIIRPRTRRKVERVIADFEAGRRHYHGLFGSDGLVILPTVGIVAPKHGDMNRASLRPGVNRDMTAVTFCNAMNLPAISIPAWSDPDPKTGLPPSVMLACAPGSEALLLDAAQVVEEVLYAG